MDHAVLVSIFNGQRPSRIIWPLLGRQARSPSLPKAVALMNAIAKYAVLRTRPLRRWEQCADGRDAATACLDEPIDIGLRCESAGQIILSHDTAVSTVALLHHVIRRGQSPPSAEFAKLLWTGREGRTSTAARPVEFAALRSMLVWLAWPPSRAYGDRPGTVRSRFFVLRMNSTSWRRAVPHIKLPHCRIDSDCALSSNISCSHSLPSAWFVSSGIAPNSVRS